MKIVLRTLAEAQGDAAAGYNRAGAATLHEKANTYLSASVCKWANISYRTGRMTINPGPKFANDPEANKPLTLDSRES